MKPSLRSAFSTIRDGFRAQLWPLPLLGVLLALFLGILLPVLDARVDDDLPGAVEMLVFSGDPDAARTVLGAVSSSLITVTSLTFSLTVVTLQLASSQFSPRLLRTFAQDLFVQNTLALFLSTFTYSLTVLRSIRSADGTVVSFVPRIAVTTSYLFGVASVVVLVLFLAHLVRQIRVEIMLRNVFDGAISTLKSNLDTRGEAEDKPTASKAALATPSGARMLTASDSGFLVRIDEGELVELATEDDLVIKIDRPLGAFLVERTPLGAVWRRDLEVVTDSDLEKLTRAVEGAVHTGIERNGAQDLGFGLRQLTDVVNKALSPGINDPTTAIHGLGHVSALLATMMDFDLGPRTYRDDDDQLRLIVADHTFADKLELAVGQPRRYGRSDPQVMVCLYQVLDDLAWRSGSRHREAIANQLQRLNATVDAEDFDATERASFAGQAEAVKVALARPAPQSSDPRDEA